MHLRPFILGLASFISTLGLAAKAAESVPEKIEYNRDVRPILSENCFKCHGFDAKQRKADLRLDTFEGATADHEGSRAIVPRDLKKSSVHERIHSTDEDEVMPPKETGKKLTEQQRAILDKWIEQGAEFQPHWSYIKPVRKDEAGKTKDENPIDALVRARLQMLKLTPAPEADRATLCRRLHLDLTGLPPSPAAVDAFVKDGAPDAVENLVDKLLASDQHAERMAVSWLDVVRFADTIGYHSDNPRNIWPYRDYVIRAFKENMRFDQFTREQVAGDLLPESTPQQKVASAFNKLNMSTVEGGSQPKDYEARNVADRVRAIGTVWLAQTFGCVQCHDHKYDPIKMRDFYAMGAFFADIQEPANGNLGEGMLISSPEQDSQLKKLDAALADAKKRLEATTPEIDAALKQWTTDVREKKVELAELKKESKASAPDKKAANAVHDLIIKNAETLKPADSKVIAEYFRGKVTKLLDPERKGVATAQKQRDEYYAAVPKCLVSVSMATPRTVRILPRGNWMDETGEVMKPALPGFLSQAKNDKPLTRIDLANWLISRDNPLTARVFVNRLWKQYFGTGLSKVLDDLGAQGETPANQALLDWLACEFMDSGWDMRHMTKLIVTSATYRQSSNGSKESVQRDPYNRELARQSRFRLDAEFVRDNALAISGLLVPKIGGPSVKPYQPEGYWDNLNFPVRKWEADKNENQWRRGLYTWWQRSYLQPSLLAFDAPSREECCAERVRSNIPQQALVLLNDPTYVEASRAFALRILKECNGDTAGRISWAWKQATARPPKPEELQTVSALFEKHLAAYKADADAAKALNSTGIAPAPADVPAHELAAWTSVARTILNLHETITRL